MLLFTFQNLEAQQFRQVARFNDLEAGVSSMTVDDDRRQLIIGDEKGNLYFRDLATGTLKKLKLIMHR